MEKSESLIEQERVAVKNRRRNIVHDLKTCFKCKGTPHLQYRNKLVVCKVCFKNSVVESHFRSTLRGYLQPKPTNVGKVLVLVSGGPSSTALALMMGETVNCKSESKRKMFVEAEMLYVDESIFYPEDKEMWDKNQERLRNLAERVELKLNYASISEKLKLDRTTAQELLDSCSDRGSSKEDVITLMRQTVIQDTANKLGFKHLLVGENALRVASNTLTAIVKGKGLWFESVSKEITQFIPGESDLLVCRPLREFSSKEVYFYVHSNDLTKFTITRPHLTEFASIKVSNLPGKGNYTLVLDTFLEMLQKDFTSTIFTILKTSDRTKVGPTRPGTKCVMCRGLIEISEHGDCCYGCLKLAEHLHSEEYVKKFLTVNPE